MLSYGANKNKTDFYWVFLFLYQNSLLILYSFIATGGQSTPTTQPWVGYCCTASFLVKKKKTFKFCIGVEPINNAVMVSGGQQRDSAVPIHVPILLQTPLPSRLPHDIEQSSLYYTVGTCWLFILNIAVCTCPSRTP